LFGRGEVTCIGLQEREEGVCGLVRKRRASIVGGDGWPAALFDEVARDRFHANPGLFEERDPRLYVLRRSLELHDQLADLFKVLNVTTNPIPVKAALNLLGHDVGGLRLPLVAADEDETAAIRDALERHGLLAAAP